MVATDIVFRDVLTRRLITGVLSMMIRHDLSTSDLTGTMVGAVEDSGERQSTSAAEGWREAGESYDD